MSSSPPPPPQPSLIQPPPPVPHTTVTFPRAHVLLVTLSRPAQLNCIPREQHFALERLWDWYDDEPWLRCAVLTGSGRAFCAGADLKEWDGQNNEHVAAAAAASSSSSPAAAAAAAAKQQPQPQPQRRDRPSNRFPRLGGFGGLSNRGGMKPVVAAVNGVCLGGGMEMAVNCDIVVAASGGRAAVFGLPEVTIGVIALAGALPRLVRTVGRQRAAEMALVGGKYGSEQMERWGLVNEVVDTGEKGKVSQEESNAMVVEAALRWAEKICGNSPDAVVVSREGLKLGWEAMGPEMGTETILKGWYERMEKGENMLEGVKSFVERRKPVWKDSKL